MQNGTAVKILTCSWVKNAATTIIRNPSLKSCRGKHVHESERSADFASVFEKVFPMNLRSLTERRNKRYRPCSPSGTVSYTNYFKQRVREIISITTANIKIQDKTSMGNT